MASTDQAPPRSAAEPLPGFRPGPHRPARADAADGWRIPAPRAGGDAPRVLPATTLNARDRELLRHLAEGRSTAQIAAALSVSGNTTRTRIRRVSAKLAVTDRAAVVPAARVLGLV